MDPYTQLVLGSLRLQTRIWEECAQNWVTGVIVTRNLLDGFFNLAMVRAPDAHQ